MPGGGLERAGEQQNEGACVQKACAAGAGRGYRQSGGHDTERGCRAGAGGMQVRVRSGCNVLLGRGVVSCVLVQEICGCVPSQHVCAGLHGCRAGAAAALPSQRLVVPAPQPKVFSPLRDGGRRGARGGSLGKPEQPGVPLTAHTRTLPGPGALARAHAALRRRQNLPALHSTLNMEPNSNRQNQSQTYTPYTRVKTSTAAGGRACR